MAELHKKGWKLGQKLLKKEVMLGCSSLVYRTQKQAACRDASCSLVYKALKQADEVKSRPFTSLSLHRHYLLRINQLLGRLSLACVITVILVVILLECYCTL